MDLQGRLVDATGAGKAGIAVNLYDATDTDTILANTTTAATTGLWEFTGKDDDVVHAVKIGPDGSNYYWIYGSIDVQAANICAAVTHTLSPTTLTISAGGAVAITQDNHVLAANSGTTDDVLTITGGYQGQEVVFEADTGDTITFTHNAAPSTNEIVSKTDKIISGYDQICYRFNGTYWKFCWIGDCT